MKESNLPSAETGVPRRLLQSQTLLEANAANQEHHLSGGAGKGHVQWEKLPRVGVACYEKRPPHGDHIVTVVYDDDFIAGLNGNSLH